MERYGGTECRGRCVEIGREECKGDEEKKGKDKRKKEKSMPSWAIVLTT